MPGTLSPNWFPILLELVSDRLDLLESFSAPSTTTTHQQQQQEHQQALGKLLLMVGEFLSSEEQQELLQVTGITPKQQRQTFIDSYVLSAMYGLAKREVDYQFTRKESIE
jgi:hypothetical protein